MIENLGFPMAYDAPKGPSMWVPTSAIALQQVPLLPNWGKNRTFAMPNGASCPLSPPAGLQRGPVLGLFPRSEGGL